MEIYKHDSKRITVKDDWYPCFDGNQIGVAMQLYKFDDEAEYHVLITAYGADDFGVEFRHKTAVKEYAFGRYDFYKEFIFDKIPNEITKTWFFEHGFFPS